jgi:hypothetical protein
LEILAGHNFKEITLAHNDLRLSARLCRPGWEGAWIPKSQEERWGFMSFLYPCTELTFLGPVWNGS